MTEPATVAAVETPVVPAAVAPVVVAPAATPAAVIPEVVNDGIVAVEYEPSGDPGLDVALGFVGKLGFGADHPAMKAAMDGNFDLMKASLATLGAKATGWEQMVALAEAANTRLDAAAATATAATNAAVETIAGGKDQWAAVQAWSAKNATPAEKAELNRLFDSGMMGARAAAKLLVDLYTAAPGTVKVPANATRDAGNGVTAPNSGPLTPREYSAAVRALASKMGGGGRMERSPEYADLKSRFAASRG